MSVPPPPSQPDDLNHDHDHEKLGNHVDLPGYNERLAYGTDQGRWLVEQVGSRADAEGAAKRRGRPVARVYHDDEVDVPEAKAPAAGEQRPGNMQSAPGGLIIASVAVVGVMTLLLVLVYIR